MKNPALFQISPGTDGIPFTHITLRDLFAAVSMATMQLDERLQLSAKEMAEHAYADADAMLEARRQE